MAGNLNISTDSACGHERRANYAVVLPKIRQLLSLPGVPSITFPPPTGAGGSINIHGREGTGSHASSVLIDGAGSGIFTNTVGTGAAGNTNIFTHLLTIQNGGTISAATSGTVSSATGGTITVNADTWH